ncbi:uncharacterized protein LOC113214422 isoform X1 [Frankliniella occidentalis]|uniref:Uncharacterized protein LOC113214422 isoform X1 n=1 Tax=Frankliniella occidentalis TaxID=133901 RepID=A0A6J1STK1_FRAOC|nr:uncharacterized protein LOC113214422 isoform X1 [Frankliniella occidentalis]XP_052125770.1 uncharacterized protein LOC113214422 isoform X1 [Frankliniella occidentalis]
MDLKCDICFLNFDVDSHRPKCLPCGHTICKECVENPAMRRKCPTCRKAFKQHRPEDLPDNVLAVRLLENEAAPPCKKPKTEDPELEQLQRGADAGQKVVEMLRLVVPQAVESLNRHLESSVAQLGQVKQALQRRVQREAAGDVGTTSDAVEEPLQLAEQLEASHRLLTSTKCTVAAEEEGGSAWTASVQPGGCGDILRVLLLQLRADGQLGKIGHGDHGGITVPATPAAAYVGPPLFSILGIDDKLLDQGRLKVDDIIRNTRQSWIIPRSLQNLRGGGSAHLLRVMGAHLEELHIAGLSEPSVMMEVEKLSSLKRLRVQCAPNVVYPDLPLQLEELEISQISENQLRCVQRMDRLRNLQLFNYVGPNLTFPPAQHGRLLWLSMVFRTQQKPTMLSLISAHASSLQELMIACSLSADPEYADVSFPDLGQELAACRMPALRRLVLLRPTSPKNECIGRVAECVLQRRTIRGLLGPSVEVLCRMCSIPEL